VKVGKLKKLNNGSKKAIHADLMFCRVISTTVTPGTRGVDSGGKNSCYACFRSNLAMQMCIVVVVDEEVSCRTSEYDEAAVIIVMF
jgi:hypothetical protein